MAQSRDNFRKTLIVNGSIIGGSFILAIVGMYFIGVDISNKAAVIAEGRNTIADRSRKISLVGELADQAPEARELQATVGRLLPREEELLSLSQNLNGIGRATDVDVSFSFNGDPQQPTDSRPGYVDISLGVRGELNAINNFISSLEFRSTRFLIEVASVSIREVDPAYRADVSGRVFFAQE